MEERGEAIPFIIYNQGNGYQITEEARELLVSLEKKKLGVVSVVGKYRTGKSYFINKVLLKGSEGGFQVGPSINPCTKGLWIWKKTLKNNDNRDFIIIDTEGFGSVQEGVNHDTKIFIFSILLSSYFIYNSVG